MQLIKNHVNRSICDSILSKIQGVYLRTADSTHTARMFEEINSTLNEQGSLVEAVITEVQETLGAAVSRDYVAWLACDTYYSVVEVIMLQIQRLARWGKFQTHKWVVDSTTHLHIAMTSCDERYPEGHQRYYESQSGSSTEVVDSEMHILTLIYSMSGWTKDLRFTAHLVPEAE